MSIWKAIAVEKVRMGILYNPDFEDVHKKTGNPQHNVTTFKTMCMGKLAIKEVINIFID